MEMNDPLSPVVGAASGFAALGSEQRLSVLITLVRAGPEGLAIGQLGQRCGITGSTLTHHLKVLTHAELVRQTRQGRQILCAANYDRVEALSEFLLSQCCHDAAERCEDHSHD